MSLIYNGTTLTSVVYNGTSLTEVIYNGTSVWTAGFLYGMFYGGLGTGNSNKATKIDNNGVLVGSEMAIGTARYGLSGANVGGNGLFYGGSIVDGAASTNKTTRISKDLTLVGSETAVGGISYTFASSGANIDVYGIFSYTASYNPEGYNTVSSTRLKIDSNGALVTTLATAIGTNREASAGASLLNMALVYGGNNAVTLYNKVTRIDINLSIIGSETSVSTSRTNISGANVGGNGLFYSGYTTAVINKATKIDTNGALVGSEASVGTSRGYGAGASVGDNGLFYGGFISASTNKTTRISKDLTLVGSETAVGTARYSLGGAGV